MVTMVKPNNLLYKSNRNDPSTNPIDLSHLQILMDTCWGLMPEDPLEPVVMDPRGVRWSSYSNPIGLINP